MICKDKPSRMERTVGLQGAIKTQHPPRPHEGHGAGGQGPGAVVSSFCRRHRKVPHLPDKQRSLLSSGRTKEGEGEQQCHPGKPGPAGQSLLHRLVRQEGRAQRLPRPELETAKENPVVN